MGLDVFEDFLPGELFGAGDFEGEEDGLIGPAVMGFFPDGLRVVVVDDLVCIRIVELGDVAEPDFEEVGELGHGADGGARGFDGVLLLDGDGGTHVLGGVEVGLFQQVEELAGVGAEGLDVAALAFGVKGVEYERGFAGAAQPSDRDVFAEGNIDVDILEVVLAYAAQADGLWLGARFWHWAGIYFCDLTDLLGSWPQKGRKTHEKYWDHLWRMEQATIS